jgi:hypothetical protein
MSFQLPYIPYTKFPKKMFVLQGAKTEGYPEIAYACPWWYLSETVWWQNKDKTKFEENGLFEYFENLDNSLHGINFGLYVLMGTKKGQIMNMSAREIYQLTTHPENDYMLQSEHYFASRPVQLENITSHKSNKIIFCTITALLDD